MLPGCKSSQRTGLNRAQRIFYDRSMTRASHTLPETVTTDIAMELTGMNPDFVDNTMRAQVYPCPPPVVHRQRRWAVFDLVCGRWFAALCRTGMHQRLAGQCAQVLLRMLQERPAPEYYVISYEDGQKGVLEFLTEPPTKPGQTLCFVVPAERWVSDMEHALEQHLRKNAKRRGTH